MHDCVRAVVIGDRLQASFECSGTCRERQRDHPQHRLHSIAPQPPAYRERQTDRRRSLAEHHRRRAGAEAFIERVAGSGVLPQHLHRLRIFRR